MKLYDLDLSGNCYKIRLFLSLIGQECEIVPVDFLGGAHRHLQRAYRHGDRRRGDRHERA